MTASETRIAKLILECLHALDGAQAHALTIHGEIGGLNACPTAEFNSVMGMLDRDRLIIGVVTKFKGTMWCISPRGEAALITMT